ncbi:hypothetical protein [Thermococcus indicus]|uniref:hypothetical protein n=1 Tax=Thermococcus indicus TaxID=2586643 RepID=UPI001F0ED4D7|nr:hypothetical protein [Thermococcus indicus]
MNVKRVSYMVIALVLVSSVLLFVKPYVIWREGGERISGEVVVLPEPRLTGEMSVEEAIAKRRSIRSYRNEPLTFFFSQASFFRGYDVQQIAFK